MTDFNVIYNIIAQDKFSAVGNKFASVANKIKTKVGVMNRALDKSRDKFRKLDATVGKAGRNLKNFGKGVTGKVGLAAGAFAGNALRLFNVQAQAVAKVQALIVSTKGAAKLSLRELQTEASRLQTESLFGDEEILDSMAQLLTFTNLSGKQFKETEQVVMDLATTIGGNLNSTAIQLGKVLNDPIKNLASLSRVGVAFTKQEESLIKGLAEGGKMAESQSLILKILSNQYGGTAAAAAAAGTGPLTQLWNILGDINEVIGKEIMEIIRPFIAKLKEMAINFQNLSPRVKKAIAVVALLVTVIGPLLIVFGSIIAMLPFMAAGFALVSAALSPILIPILAVVAAFTAAYYIGTVISDWLKEQPELWNTIGSVIDAIIHPITTVIDLFDKIMSYDFGSVLGEIADFFGFGDASAEINAKSKSESKVDVNLNAPEGMVKSVKSRSNGNTQVNVGTNMVATAQ